MRFKNHNNYVPIINGRQYFRKKDNDDKMTSDTVIMIK